MKIAVLSDIHGNDIAFEAAVNDAKAHGAEMFIVAGDLISDYPLSSAVIARAKTLTTYVVKGNREKYFERYFYAGDLHWKEYKQFASLLWIFDHMTSDDLAYISNLPERITVPIGDNQSIFVAHHLPDNSYSMFDPDKYMADVAETIPNIAENILVCGHTHTPFVKWIGNKLFVNPGSVGVNFSGNFTTEYAMIDHSDKQITAEILHVSYDGNTLKDLLIKSGILENEDAKHWFYLILKSQENGRNYISEFFQTTEKLKTIHRYSCYDTPNDIWDKVIEVFKQRKIL